MYILLLSSVECAFHESCRWIYISQLIRTKKLQHKVFFTQSLIDLNSQFSFSLTGCYTNVILFTNPSARAGYDTRSIFKRSFTGLNSEFSFSSTSCPTKAKELSLSYYLPIARGRIIGVIPFPSVLVLCEMQSVSSRIWTRVAVFISYDDKNYTTGYTNVIEPSLPYRLPEEIGIMAGYVPFLTVLVLYEMLRSAANISPWFIISMSNDSNVSLLMYIYIYIYLCLSGNILVYLWGNTWHNVTYSISSVPACLIHLTWIVGEMRRKAPNSSASRNCSKQCYFLSIFSAHCLGGACIE